MTLITITEGTIGPAWNGDSVPVQFRLYANRDFVASDGTFISKGSDRADDFFQPFAVSIDEDTDQIIIAEGEAYSTTDALNDDGLTTYTGAVYDADGRMLKKLFSNWRIPHDYGSTLNWNIIDAFSQGVRQKRPSTYLSSQAILYILSGYEFAYTSAISALGVALTAAYQAADAILAAAINLKQDLLVSGTNIKTINTQSLLGAGDIEITAGDLAEGEKNEIEVVNSAADWTVIQPQLVAVKSQHHASAPGFALATLKAAAAGSPSTIFILQVDATLNETVSNTHPDNLFLDFSKGGVLSVAAGQTVDINYPMNAPETKILHGAGKAVIKKQAGAHLIKAVWWLDSGIDDTVIITASRLEAMLESQSNNEYSTLLFPVGYYSTTSTLEITKGSIMGSGTHQNTTGGTVLELTSNGVPLIQVMPGAHNVTIGNIGLFAEDTVTGADGILLEGEAGVDPVISQVTLTNVKTFGFDYGVRADRIGTGSYQINDLWIDRNCGFVNYVKAGLKVNTTNSGIYAEVEQYAGKWNGQSVCGEILRSGTLLLRGQAFGRIADAVPAGPHFECERFTVDPSAFNTTTNEIDAPDHGLQTGDSVRMWCPATEDDADLPTTSNWSFANGKKSWVRRVDGDTITLHRSAYDASVGTEIVDITVQPLEDVEIHSNRPNAAIAAVRPRACWYFGSQFAGGGVRVEGWQDEGIPYFAIFEDPEFTGDGQHFHQVPFIFDHCMSQGQVLFKRSASLIINGGSYCADFLQDDYGVGARIYNFGHRFLIYGQLIYNRGGFFVPPPYRSDDFRGNSAMEFDLNHEGGNLSGRHGNGPFHVFRSYNNAAKEDIDLALYRQSFGSYPGDDPQYPAFWDLRNNYNPDVNPLTGAQMYNGLRAAMSFVIKGFFRNELPLIPATGAGANQISLDLSQGNEFSVTPVENAAIVVVNAPDGTAADFRREARMSVKLHILTSGTSSFTLTPGTDVIMRGNFETGTADGVYTVIPFVWNGEKLIEEGR